MPRLQDIDRLKRDLASLAGEAEVLERWGERPEDIPPPEGASDSAASSRAAAAESSRARPSAPLPLEPVSSGPESSGRARPRLEDALPPDFTALLDGLPLEGEPSNQASPIDMDLAALLGDQVNESVSTPIADDELAALFGTLEPSSGMEALEEAPAEKEPAIEPEGTVTDSTESEEYDFDLASFVAPPEDVESGEEPSATKPFDLGPLGDGAAFDFASTETLPEGSADTAPETPAFDFPGFSFDEENAGNEEPNAVETKGADTTDFFGALDDVGAPKEALPSPIDEVSQTGISEGTDQDFSFDLGGESPDQGSREADDFSVPDFGASGDELGELGGEDRGIEAEREAEESFGLQGEEGPSFSPDAAPTDAFESFSFEEPASDDFGASFGQEPAIQPGRGGARDLDTEIDALSEEAPAADTFNIDREWGGFGDFGAPAAPPRQTAPRPTASRSSVAPKEKARVVALNEAQVDKLQDSLLSYPLNLRIAVEDILANAKGSDVQQAKLVWAMVEGATAAEVASIAGKVLKRSIAIPKGYEKRTGAAFEAKKGSLGYALVHTILPALRVGLLAIAAASILGYLGWRFIYTPLAANALYRSGYERIAEDRYPEADASFAKATAMREFVSWYYRYAEAYAAKRQYLLAEKKYKNLLDLHPSEKNGALAWAELERQQLKYKSAIDILKQRVLEKEYFDEKAMLLSGDIYLDWAREDPKMYEEARRNFAGLIEHYGAADRYLERMLLFFVRTDNFKETATLKRHFLEGVEGKTALSATTLAELGGYLLDKGELADVSRILIEAAVKDPRVPEAHYHLARYFIRADAPEEEAKALDNAIGAFVALPSLSSGRTGMYIESLVWRGRHRLAAKEWLSAEQDFASAATEYEKALELRRVKKSARYGEAYAGLAEVAFWQRDDLNDALKLYEKAASHGYETPQTLYRQGYIDYRVERPKEAIESFYLAARDGTEGPYLAFALGASLYARSDWFAAEAYFRRVVELMRKELSQIGQPSPQEKPSEAEIVDLLMKAENNLGVALYRAAARVGDARRRGEAMAAFAEASRLFDSLTRDQASFIRSDAKNLGFLNMDFVLHPRRDIDLVIFPEIERDPAFPKKG